MTFNGTYQIQQNIAKSYRRSAEKFTKIFLMQFEGLLSDIQWNVPDPAKYRQIAIVAAPKSLQKYMLMQFEHFLGRKSIDPSHQHTGNVTCSGSRDHKRITCCLRREKNQS